jgi:hypothetical protein
MSTTDVESCLRCRTHASVPHLSSHRGRLTFESPNNSETHDDKDIFTLEHERVPEPELCRKGHNICIESDVPLCRVRCDMNTVLLLSQQHTSQAQTRIINREKEEGRLTSNLETSGKTHWTSFSCTWNICKRPGNPGAKIRCNPYWSCNRTKAA